MKSSYHLLEVTPAALTEIKNSKPLGIQSLIPPYGGTCTKIITMTKKKKQLRMLQCHFLLLLLLILELIYGTIHLKRLHISKSPYGQSVCIPLRGHILTTSKD